MRLLSLLLLLLTVSLPANAQQLIGAGVGMSYERRDEAPESGIGFRLEKNVINLLVVNVRTQLQTSVFSGDVRQTAGGFIQGKTDVYDISGAITTGLGLGLFGPYAGLGFGFERVQYNSISGRKATHETYASALVGVAITPVPFLKPFVEYRYNSFLEDPDAYRVSVGLMLRF